MGALVSGAFTLTQCTVAYTDYSNLLRKSMLTAAKQHGNALHSAQAADC